MHVPAMRRPGQCGTQKLVTHYGERLVCVRYRYDPGIGKRYKTIELIIQELPSTSPPPHPKAPRPAPRGDGINDPWQPRDVGVKVFYRESDLREQAKAAGGRWLKDEKLWQMPLATAVSLGLQHRIAKR